MALDIGKALRDTAYIAIGIGVLGVQEAQRAVRSTRARFDDRGCGANARVRTTVDEVRVRMQELGDEVTKRVEPLRSRVTASPAA